MRRPAIIATLIHAFALPAAAQVPPRAAQPQDAQLQDAQPQDAQPQAAALAASPTPLAQHLPLHAAYAGTVELRFEVREPDRVRGVIVRCIPRSAKPSTHGVEARRASKGYVANVPAACARPPGFRYWAVLVTAEGEQPLFASASAPHEVRVTLTPERELELSQLRANAYKRSRVVLAAEGVSFGDRRPTPGAPVAHDRYYRLETGYGYSFFGFIEDIALTLVRVRGESATATSLSGDPELQALDPGVDYGRATVTLRVVDFVRTRSSLLLGASQKGFEHGWSGELLLGDPLAEHLSVGAETLTTLGTTGFLHMGFDALPTIPMGARVEVTDFPLGEDAAVRLLYEVGYRFTPATELRLRGGYQGRTSVVGGPSLGATFRYGF